MVFTLNILKNKFCYNVYQNFCAKIKACTNTKFVQVYTYLDTKIYTKNLKNTNIKIPATQQ